MGGSARGQTEDSRTPVLEAPPTCGRGEAEVQQTRWMPEPAHLTVCNGAGPVDGEGTVRRGNLFLASTCP